MASQLRLWQRLAGVALLAIFCGAAAAEAGPLFDYREITLSNGLRVLTLEDFSCPIVAVQVWYHVGSKDENPERQGFAHMFEHMMFKGSELLGSSDPEEYFRRAGGECNAYTTFDQTVYHETLPVNQLELALWCEAERMAYLKIDQESFDTERKVVEEERRLGLNRPYGTLFEKALAEIFHEHPYRWSTIGKIPHLRAAQVRELREFWTRYYVPANATLVIVGAVKHEEAQQLARRYFEWLPHYDEPPRIAVREPMPTESRTVQLKEENAPTPVVGVVYHTVAAAHEDAIPLELLASILGGGESSRLYRELVAERQLAVGAMSISATLEQHGLFVLGAAMSPLGGDAKEVMATFGKHIKRLREEPIGERELLKARNQMLSGLVMQNLTVNSKAGALGNAAVIEGDAGRLNHRLDDIRRVTAEDLQRVANTYFGAGRALKFNIERNLLGTLLGSKNEEEDAPVTAEREESAPPPGRPGQSRPDSFPRTPPLAGPQNFDPQIASETRTLASGLKVVVVPNHEVPAVTLDLGLKTGAWTETKPGTASMTLSMLTKGTDKHTEAQLADELETYAISLSGYSEMDSATVNVNCLTEHVERAMSFLAEVVQAPTFPAEEFEKLRKQVVTSLTVSNSEPAHLAERELRRRLYGAHPYARAVAGEIEDVQALAAEDSPTWWKANARPDAATLLIAGDVEPGQAFKLVESAFGEWKAEGAPPPATLPPPPSPTETHIYLVDMPGVQAQIRIGQLGITRQHPGYFTSRVVSEYFGGAFKSRLNKKIRVEKGLTYGAGGGFSASRFLGQFRASTFSKIPSTAEALQILLDEMKRLQADPPDAQELGDTQAHILGKFASERETPEQVAAQLWNVELNGLSADWYDQLLAGVSHTQPADCTRLASETLDPSKLVIVVVGPAAELKGALEKIAPVTVVERKANSE
jgi:zinc protease